MDFLVISAILVLVPVGAIAAYFVRSLAAQRRQEASFDDCLVLSAARYQPMARLLREEEFQFLAAQDGYSPELGRRFRTQRRRVFRGYLRSLKKDFAIVTTALQTLIVHSAEDRGDLAAAVVRQRLTFAAAVLAVEGRLLLHAAGIGAVQIDVRGLVDSLEAMQSQMRMLLAPPEASMAAV